MKTYYLNNTGHRFVIRNDDSRNIQIKLLDFGVIRRAKYFQMLGNTAYVAAHYRGKLIKTFNYEVVS